MSIVDGFQFRQRIESPETALDKVRVTPLAAPRLRVSGKFDPRARLPFGFLRRPANFGRGVFPLNRHAIGRGTGSCIRDSVPVAAFLDIPLSV